MMLIALTAAAFVVTIASAYVGQHAEYYWFMGLLWFGFLPAATQLQGGTPLSFVAGYVFGATIWLGFSALAWKLGI